MTKPVAGFVRADQAAFDGGADCGGTTAGISPEATAGTAPPLHRSIRFCVFFRGTEPRHQYETFDGATFNAKAAFCCAPSPKRASMYVLNASDHMRDKFTDSEPSVNVAPPYSSESTAPWSRKIARMKEKESDEEVYGQATGTNPVLSRFIWERLREEVDPTSALAIHEQTGVSRATLSNIRAGNGTYGVGATVAKKLVKYLGFKDYDDLWRAAMVAHEARTETRYPELAEALRRAAGTDRWRPQAIAAAKATPLKESEIAACDVEWWTQYLDRIDATLIVQMPPIPSSVAKHRKR